MEILLKEWADVAQHSLEGARIGPAADITSGQCESNAAQCLLPTSLDEYEIAGLKVVLQQRSCFPCVAHVDNLIELQTG